MKHLKQLGISLTLLAAVVSTPAIAQSTEAAFGGVLTQILNEVKLIQSTLLTYYGDKDNPNNLRPASPDINTLNNLDKGLAADNANETFRLANNTYDPKVDLAPYPESATWQAIENILRTSPEQAEAVTQYMGGVNPQSALGISKLYTIKGDPNMFVGNSNEQDKANANNQILSLNSLLQPLALKTQSSDDKIKSAKATGFIRFVTGQAQPIKQMSEQNFRLLQKDPNAMATYLTAIRNYAALASVGISNFNHMLAERQVAAGSNAQSKMQLEQEMVMRRFGDGKQASAWRSRMETASPVVLQREALYLLADMNYQLYQSRLQQERILATLSAMQMQYLNTTIKENIKTLAAPNGTPN